MAKSYGKNKTGPLTVIGLMSGTSFDGVDAAILKTDGEKIFSVGNCLSGEYPDYFRDKIRKAISGAPSLKEIAELEDEITLIHAKTVHNLMKNSNLTKNDIDLIGFHGQTIFHDPKASKTWQLANGSLMVEETGINTITDFRRRDVAKGGEGAPLVPFYHFALAEKLPKPIAFLNIGGVANVTYINEKDEILGFDTGPGNALIDDWVYMRLKRSCDINGEIAKNGNYNKPKVDFLMENKFFSKKPPKSLDRNEFADALRRVSMLSTPDGAATLTEFTARSIYESRKFMLSPPKQWIICGGGRHNKYLLDILRTRYELNISIIDNIDLGGFKINGDFVEAQAFAFLAARSYYNLPLTSPSTTGVIQPVSGGAFYQV